MLTQLLLAALQRNLPSASLGEGVLFCCYLSPLNSERGPSLSELARSSGLPLSSVSRWVDKHQRQGWITVHRDVDDERIRRVILTDGGRQLRSTLRRDLDRVLIHCGWRPVAQESDSRDFGELGDRSLKEG